MTGVLGYPNLDWVYRGIVVATCLTRPQRWRCTERQNVITVPPHSRRPWMDTGWPVDKQKTAVIFWTREKRSLYDIPIFFHPMTHVPLDVDLSDLSYNHSGEDMTHGDTPKGTEFVLVIYTSHKLLEHLALRIGVCKAFEARQAYVWNTEVSSELAI